MTKQNFCRVLLAVVAIFGVLAFTNVLSAQGNSENAFEQVRDVQERHTDVLMARSGVVGTAVGLNDDGEFAVLVLLERPGVAGIPQEIEGVPVQVVVTGEILALATTDWFARPVPIGVSTGHPDITAGTIACRVTDGTNFYALSNNHVYANSNEASLGDAVIQPGTYDKGSSPADDIGTLADFEPIVFSRRARNEIDAAIAISTIADLGNATPAAGYGTPNSTIVDASIGQQVQKFGRTTGLTTGNVTGLNATVNVGYGPGQTAKFVKQIIIEPGGFSAGGDSGSLIVTEVGNNPVGLLFAGSSSITVANQIGLVLDRFGVTVDGEVVPPPATGKIAGTVTSAADGSAIGGATVSVDTGQSDTTDVNGSYTITDVPTGNGLDVTASAGGFVSQTKTADVTDGKETTVDFDLDPALTGSTVSVASITYDTKGGRSGDKHLTIAVALVDDNSNPVAGASVSIDLFRNGSFAGAGSSTTGTNGTVTFILKNAKSGYYETIVTDVSAAGLTWVGGTPDHNFYDKK